MRPRVREVLLLLMLTVCGLAEMGTASVLLGLKLIPPSHVFGPINLAANDTLRPEISAWGLEGPVEQGVSFSAWANVSDTESGVRNVSLSVHGDNGQRSSYPLAFNGSLYMADVPGLAVNATYTLYIIAFDMANNTATSYSRTADLTQRTTTTKDPSVTTPIVVGSSLVLMAVVTVVAMIYDRRRTRQGLQ